MKKIALLSSVLAVSLALGTSHARAQIMFNAGADTFNLDYVPNADGGAHDVLTTVVATGVGISSSLTGTDLSNYATLTGGGEAVSYEDHSTGTTIPNYGDGSGSAPSSATATELFTLTANGGGTFTSLTFDPHGNLNIGGSTSIAYSINGGASFTPDVGTGIFTITPGAGSVEVLETENLTNVSYSAILNRGGGPDPTGNNGALSIAAVVAPGVVAVPEPSTYALMLGGLGALVFFARRRSNA